MRKNFHKLPLQRQIQIGVISVSCFACFMIFAILLTTTLIMVNLTYIDISNMIYIKENQQLDQLGLYFDVKSNVMTETTKYSIQWIRNFLKNNSENKEFMNNLINIDISKNIRNLDEPQNYSNCNYNQYLNSCIFYKVFDDTIFTQNFDENLKSEFENYLKILTISVPLIQQTFSYRYQDSKKIPIFNSLVFYSNKFKSIFIYKPEKETRIEDFYDNTYNLNDLNNFFEITCSNLYTRAKRDEEKINLNKDIKDFLMKNPVQTYFVANEKSKIPYYTSVKSANALINTLSVNYKTLNSIEEILNADEIIDIVQGDWSTDLIDRIFWETVKSYKGINAIIADTSDFVVISSNCHYFIKYYEMINGYNNYTQGNVSYNPLRVKDCIIDEQARSKLIELIGMKEDNTNSTHSSDTYDVKRKIHIPLFNSYKNKNKLSDNLFKIVKYSTPDYQTKVFLNTFFNFVTRANLYIFKTTKLLEKSLNELWNFFLRIVIYIIFYNLMTWFIFLIVIIIVVVKVSNDITTPIDRLIEEVIKLGGGEGNSADEKSSEEKEKQIRSIENKNSDEGIIYSDDADINEMFEICESLIKGGFMENSNSNTKKSDDANLISAYNNVAFVKTNDLIILEDYIEHHATNNKSIFSWKKESDEIKKNNDSKQSKDYNTDVSENINVNVNINTNSDKNKINNSSTENNLTSVNKSNLNNETTVVKKDTKSFIAKGFWNTKKSEKRFNAMKKENNSNFNKTQSDMLNAYSDLLQMNIDKNLEEYIANLVSDYDNRKSDKNFFMNLNSNPKREKENKKNNPFIEKDKLESDRNDIENKEELEEDIFQSRKGYLNSLFMSKTNNGNSLYLDVY